jgi:ATP-dependent Clp protease adaptor protein ClpS
MPQIAKDPKLDDLSTDSGRWKVVIHNNDTNAYDEVIITLMVATGCDVQEAEIETWEAHHFGRADVHFGSESECLQVAQTIAQIGVQTDVQREFED